ncbi:MAG TPA: sensor domain-containing protein [Gaiellaceae bacterium]|nr:sensor domain-containing protein [Gaiellaceae bacterium]
MGRVRTLLFMLAIVLVAPLVLGVLIAGWTTVSVLAITPLAVPALVGFRAAIGGIARLDGEIANGLLGTSVRPAVRSPGPRGFWRAGLNVLSDGSFWRQQAYLLVRQSVGFGIAVATWSLLAASLGALTLPIWYRWGTTLVVGRHVDTLGRALLGVPTGIVGLVILFLLLRPLATGSRLLVASLLGGGEEGGPPPSLRERRQSLAVHAATYGVVNLALTLIWALTSRGYFWPEWTFIALGLPLAVHAVSELATERVPAARHSLAVHGGAAVSASVFFTLIWAVTSRGYFWPVWPIIALALSFVVHAIAELGRRGRRISELEETRAGAVDQQESELERIERDLHDGAQARLVALGMSLGMAEQKLATDPVAAQELLAEARKGTREALEELRSLARGIHPPVLADRGLEAAISALADRTPLQVNIAVDLPRRPPRAVETAAYFVAAEALANAGKHAGATNVYIAVREDAGELAVEVVDDGTGGADAAGNGLSGLARRVEALDGRLDVISPAGGPTTIRAVMPCGS